MKILCKAFGDFGTNCYLVITDKGTLIIDPGVGASQWVKQSLKNENSKAIAILCTHGHFDHVNDVNELKQSLKVPVYIHENDAFMLESGYQFGFKFDPTKADFAISEGVYNKDGVEFEFMHFPGHTPGCCMIRVNDVIFSGDFLFKSSIGRWDFEYSNPADMIASLNKCAAIKGEYEIYPGHGEKSTLKTEQSALLPWAEYIRRSL